MTTELTAQVVLNEGMHFTGTAESGYAVSVDAARPFGKGAGFLPMELLLISLASCSAMDVLSILRKKGQRVHSLDVRARGQRRDSHPTVFTAIALEFIVWGEEIDQAAVARSIELAAERYCPVWAMLEQSARITSSFRVMTEETLPVPMD